LPPGDNPRQQLPPAAAHGALAGPACSAGGWRACAPATGDPSGGADGVRLLPSPICQIFSRRNCRFQPALTCNVLAGFRAAWAQCRLPRFRKQPIKTVPRRLRPLDATGRLCYARDRSAGRSRMSGVTARVRGRPLRITTTGSGRPGGVSRTSLLNCCTSVTGMRSH